jgi:hypothetical protein
MRRLKRNVVFGLLMCTTGLSVAIAPPLIAQDVTAQNPIAQNPIAQNLIAHNVEVAGEVAGTWHIEPNHAPKAGEPATVWVALTRKGGALLPLTEANCQFNIFDRADASGKALLKPAVKPLNVENYQGIPSAELVFPKPGLYQIKLNCTPKTDGGFAAFELTSEATVTAGANTSENPASVNPASVNPASVNPAGGTANAATIATVPDPNTPNPEVRTRSAWRNWVVVAAVIVGAAAALWKRNPPH